MMEQTKKVKEWCNKRTALELILGGTIIGVVANLPEISYLMASFYQTAIDNNLYLSEHN